MVDETSKVLTLVFTDLVDSTALKSERGDQAVDELISRHREHVTRLSEECSGRVIDWAGDGCFLTFDTSSAGVMFALRLQQAHAEESDLPAVRIGIHLGEVTEKDGPDHTTYVKGLAVDVAARVQGLAKPGQVLMSSSVYNSARQRMGVDTLGQPILWQLHGLYDLKGFDHPLEIGEAGLEGLSPLEAPDGSEKAKPVALSLRPEQVEVEVLPPPVRRGAIVPALIVTILVAGLAAAYWFGRSGSESATPYDLDAPITSIAVLPLDNLSNDPEQDYFADGMTEAITAELAKIKALKVISRTSAMHYKGTTKTMPEIAAELGVQGLIEGSVLRDGEDVRITVQLIDGERDVHLWSESYTNTVTSVLKLQAEVALAIAGEIRATLEPEEQRRIEEKSEINPKAYEAYLRGELYNQGSTLFDQEQSLEYFEQAIRLEPRYADAWSGKTRAYLNIASRGLKNTQEQFPLARQSARRALEIDPQNGQAHANLAWIAAYTEWDWSTAEEQFLRAVELAPNDSRIHTDVARYYVFAGDDSKAKRYAVRAVELDPLSAQIRRNSAEILLLAGDAAAALLLAEEAYLGDSAFESLQRPLAWISLNMGRHDDAIAYAEGFAKFTQDDVFSSTTRMRIFAAAGRPEDAKTILNELLSESELYVDPNDIAETYLALGEIDNAFRWFYKGLEEHTVDTLWIRLTANGRWFPDSANVERFRNDRRYWDFVERVGFPPYVPGHPFYSRQQEALLRRESVEAANAPIEKLAVLPFDNMSSDPEQEYFVDGMTEALIAELAKIKSIRVISRTSIMQYKNTAKSLPEIARELGVDALVEGSVMKAGNEVRITAQLVHGITDEHLWADSYTNTLENVFKLQAEVALAITDEISAVVTPDERRRIASAGTVNPEAFSLYTQGRHFWSQRTEEGFDTALALFERALEIDPDFALAHSGIADVYIVLPIYRGFKTTENVSRAIEEAQRALEINPNLGEAYATLGFANLLNRWDWAQSESFFQRAIELNPGHATAHSWYGSLLGALRRDEEAAIQLAEAFQLDPLSPTIAATYGLTLVVAGQVEAGLRQLEETVRLYPNLPVVYYAYGNAQCRLREFGRAASLFQRAAELAGDSGFIYLAYLAGAYALSDDTDQAREILDRMLAAEDDAFQNAAYLAMVYAALGDVNAAFTWLERGFDQSEPRLNNIRFRMDPFLGSIKSDPRYLNLLRRLNFPDIEGVN